MLEGEENGQVTGCDSVLGQGLRCSNVSMTDSATTSRGSPTMAALARTCASTLYFYKN